jgi:hypothetical protein
MAANDLKPWEVFARRPAPLAKLLESESERILAARTPSSALPLDERERRAAAFAASPPVTPPDSTDRLG